MKKNSPQNDLPIIPVIWMLRAVFCQIMITIGARPAESGGILLGPIGSTDITDFYFDVTARCTAGTYSPDHVTLRRLMKEQWMPAGLDMKGFVHSHPPGYETLSAGDLRYIARLLERNPDMSSFAAPVVLPDQSRMRAIVVLRAEPNVPRITNIRFF